MTAAVRAIGDPPRKSNAQMVADLHTVARLTDVPTLDCTYGEGRCWTTWRPATLIRCDIDGNRLYVDFEAYMIGCEIVNLPDLFDRVPESRKWFITADSARPETISYMRSHGFPKINQSVKGKGSVEEGISFLQSFDIVVHPRCVHLIDELTMYSYKTDPLTGQVLPILQDKNNHVIDALRYACEGARRAKKAPEKRAMSIPVHRGPQGFLGA